MSSYTSTHLSSVSLISLVAIFAKYPCIYDPIILVDILTTLSNLGTNTKEEEINLPRKVHKVENGKAI